jgi:hypothetical protein
MLHRAQGSASPESVTLRLSVELGSDVRKRSARPLGPTLEEVQCVGVHGSGCDCIRSIGASLNFPQERIATISRGKTCRYAEEGCLHLPIRTSRTLLRGSQRTACRRQDSPIRKPRNFPEETAMSELLKHPGESSNDNLTAEGKAAAHTRRAFWSARSSVPLDELV